MVFEPGPLVGVARRVVQPGSALERHPSPDRPENPGRHLTFGGKGDRLGAARPELQAQAKTGDRGQDWTPLRMPMTRCLDIGEHTFGCCFSHLPDLRPQRASRIKFDLEADQAEAELTDRFRHSAHSGRVGHHHADGNAVWVVRLHRVVRDAPQVRGGNNERADQPTVTRRQVLGMGWHS